MRDGKARLVAMLALAAAALSAGCAQVVRQDTEEIAVDTGWLGRIAPGTQTMLGWPVAEYRCRQRGRSAELKDLKDAVAIYRCIGAEKKNEGKGK
jgi:hypothetical protein